MHLEKTKQHKYITNIVFIFILESNLHRIYVCFPRPVIEIFVNQIQLRVFLTVCVCVCVCMCVCFRWGQDLVVKFVVFRPFNTMPFRDHLAMHAVPGQTPSAVNQYGRVIILETVNFFNMRHSVDFSSHIICMMQQTRKTFLFFFLLECDFNTILEKLHFPQNYHKAFKIVFFSNIKYGFTLFLHNFSHDYPSI